jgi:O-antigen/teichoic acid export membrane protein
MGNLVARSCAQGGNLLRSRRTRAVGHLLTGTSATVLLSLFSVGFAARALGPTAYGQLALILTLGQACERLLSFQAWQPLIRYGASLDAQTDRENLQALYKFGLLLDVAGCTLAWGTASLLLITGHFLLGISWPVTLAGLLFMLSILFNLNGTPTAIFRICDRFRTSARLQVVNAVIRLAASAAAYAAGAGLLGFVLVWAGTQALGSVINLAISVRLLRRAGLGGFYRASLRGISARFPNLWRFTLGGNLSLTIWASAQQLDTLIVGAFADPASAGLFHIAKRVSRIVQQVGSQIEAVVYPDLSRMWAAAQRTSFVRLIIRTEMMLAAFGGGCLLASLVAGRWALELAAGPSFGAAAPLLTVQIVAVALTICGAGSRAGLLAMGLQPLVLRTVLAAALTFHAAVIPLIYAMGAMGANIAHVLFGAVWLGGLTLSLRAGLRTDLTVSLVSGAQPRGRG